MKPKLSAANAVILAAGLLMILGSFLPFYSVLGVHVTAWSAGLFGIATVVVFCGVAMAGEVALSTFGSSPLATQPFGLTWNQVHLALGFQATVMMLAFLAKQRLTIVNFGAGFWMMLVAAIALFVGALLRRRPRRPRGLRSV